MAELRTMTMEQFYKTARLHENVKITDIWTGSGSQIRVNQDDITFYCINCDKELNFFRDNSTQNFYSKDYRGLGYAKYICRNCMKGVYTFSIFSYGNDITSVNLIKLGTYPSLIAPAPKRFLDLLGKDRELYFKGKNCEDLGHGIAAFAYYRRIIENQKHKLFDQIIKVSKKLALPTDFISKVEKAKEETQFIKTKSVIMEIWPERLNIVNHNPMYILYGSVSEGIHDLSDEECLQRAHDIRLILLKFTERLDDMMQDHTEMENALKRLADRGKPS